MSDERPTDLLSGLPRTRPHRRSEKRGAPPAPRKPAEGPAPKPQRVSGASASATATPRRKARARPTAKTLRQPAQPRGIPKARRAPKRKPAPASGAEIVGTAIQAVGELAELGLTLSARALRNAVSRLPRP
jgi:hypothetical protein